MSPLADLPDAIETLAQWFYDEWHAFDGRRMENIATPLSENLNRDFMPITFVAHFNRLPLGSVSLDRFDFPAFDYLSPWLSSLYVHPSFRGKGIGNSLVRHLQHFAVTWNWSYLPLDSGIHAALRALRLGRIYIRDIRCTAR
jgi:GNAT superfamily N-acetyltransferase